jgi:co-chaperonin GroES (HSP10)
MSAFSLDFEAQNFPNGILPEPVGWRILLAPVEIKDTTNGGIILPDQVKTVMEYFRTVGRVLAMGPECYQHQKFLGKPWCAVGDIVQFSSYAGMEIVVAHGDEVCKLKIVNDDEILTVVDNPEVLNFL